MGHKAKLYLAGLVVTVSRCHKPQSMCNKPEAFLSLVSLQNLPMVNLSLQLGKNETCSRFFHSLIIRNNYLLRAESEHRNYVLIAISSRLRTFCANMRAKTWPHLQTFLFSKRLGKNEEGNRNSLMRLSDIVYIALSSHCEEPRWDELSPKMRAISCFRIPGFVCNAPVEVCLFKRRFNRLKGISSLTDMIHLP